MPRPEAEARGDNMRQLIMKGLAPEQVADQVFEAIRAEKFYILTHPTWKPLIQRRMQSILNESDPVSGFG